MVKEDELGLDPGEYSTLQTAGFVVVKKAFTFGQVLSPGQVIFVGVTPGLAPNDGSVPAVEPPFEAVVESFDSGVEYPERRKPGNYRARVELRKV